jgi:hypothetical protein
MFVGGNADTLPAATEQNTSVSSLRFYGGSDRMGKVRIIHGVSTMRSKISHFVPLGLKPL